MPSARAPIRGDLVLRAAIGVALSLHPPPNAAAAGARRVSACSGGWVGRDA